MKFWNKRKAYSNWTEVTVDQKKYPDRDEIKRWCQKHPSHYRFYNGYFNNKWYFENPEDATFFLLRWS